MLGDASWKYVDFEEEFPHLPVRQRGSQSVIVRIGITTNISINMLNT